MKIPFIINIQKFSIHDGDGIRTTVFFKGCPLSCIWCHNPESQRYTPEIMYYEDRCVHCGACTRFCPAKAINDGIETDRSLCTACGTCNDFCIQNAREAIGEQIPLETLLKKITADTAFYEVSGGGITLSGGEVLAQDMEYITTLCSRLKRRGYRIDIDTCGHVPYAHIEKVLPYTDMFLFDLKHMDPEMHRQYMGVDNALILENLRKMSDAGAPINIRLPLIAGINDDDCEIDALLDFLKDIRVLRVNLLPYHRTGSDKYERLHMQYQGTHLQPPSQERLETIRTRFLDAGYTDVKIGG